MSSRRVVWSARSMIAAELVEIPALVAVERAIGDPGVGLACLLDLAEATARQMPGASSVVVERG